MSLLKDWFQISRHVIGNPGEFYSVWDQMESYRFSLKLLVVTTAVSGFIMAIPATLFYIFKGVFYGLTAASLMSMLFLYGTLVNIFITHIILKLGGAEKGLKVTLETMACPSVLLVLWWIPGLNLLFGLYYLAVVFKGLKKFQNVSGTAAILAIVLANGVSWIVTLLSLLLLGGGLGLMAGSISFL